MCGNHTPLCYHIVNWSSSYLALLYECALLLSNPWFFHSNSINLLSDSVMTSVVSQSQILDLYENFDLEVKLTNSFLIVFFFFCNASMILIVILPCKTDN